jgi:hypothetical protein
MKKIFFYAGFALCAFTGCDAKLGSKPKVGDAIFYDYVIKQGDSVVFKAANQIEDTAFLILESNNLQQPLVEQVMKLSVHDSTHFQLDGQRTGYLRLHRIITAAEFPQYVAEAEKKEKVFEQRLRDIGKELKAVMPFYQGRQKTVIDSTVAFNTDFKKGVLTDKFKRMGDSCLYYVVKGADNPKSGKKKWVWFHYATVLPNGSKVINSYGGLPKASNVAEFGFNEQIERAAARFDEGSIILMAVPSKSFILDGKTGAVGANDYTLIWVEIVKILQL